MTVINIDLFCQVPSRSSGILLDDAALNTFRDDPFVEEFSRCHQWQPVVSYDFAKVEHINLQEASVVKREIVTLAGEADVHAWEEKSLLE